MPSQSRLRLLPRRTRRSRAAPSSRTSRPSWVRGCARLPGGRWHARCLLLLGRRGFCRPHCPCVCFGMRKSVQTPDQPPLRLTTPFGRCRHTFRRGGPALACLPYAQPCGLAALTPAPLAPYTRAAAGSNWVDPPKRERKRVLNYSEVRLLGASASCRGAAAPVQPLVQRRALAAPHAHAGVAWPVRASLQ